jgi:hypothetical protein
MPQPSRLSLAILERFVTNFYEKHPTRGREIDQLLQQYRRQDGGVQNDDEIMIGLHNLSKLWKRKAQPLSRRGYRH